MILYHGSEKIVKNPVYGGGKLYNDYGRGFYCTEDQELAREWASQTKAGGYLNQYNLDIKGLRVLHLNQDPQHILHWLAVLLEHRNIRVKNPVMKRAMQFITETYQIDILKYDVIVGYRADDSYFSYARDFLSNEISLGQLEYAMKLGELGEQVVLISERAFKQIKFQKYEEVDGKIYLRKREMRDEKSRNQYMELLEKEEKDGIFIRDIMKGGGKI